jgi:hypothetical protein
VLRDRYAITTVIETRATLETAGVVWCQPAVRCLGDVHGGKEAAGRERNEGSARSRRATATAFIRPFGAPARERTRARCAARGTSLRRVRLDYG